jgi:PIN domain nuclease of toxin-antitoxin system
VTVLDSSALLAFVLDEPGADVVEAHIAGCALGSANLAEVVGKLIDLNIDQNRLRQVIEAAGVVVEPVTRADAELAGAMRTLPGGRVLSLGDRCCLALTVRSESRRVLTADRVWKKLNLPIVVELIR